jgi:hypothetical protein
MDEGYVKYLETLGFLGVVFADGSALDESSKWLCARKCEVEDFSADCPSRQRMS